MNPYRKIPKEEKHSITEHLLNCSMCVTKVSGWDAKDFADPRSAAYLASNVSTFCDAAIRKIVKAGGTYGDNSVLIKMIVKENTSED